MLRISYHLPPRQSTTLARCKEIVYHTWKMKLRSWFNAKLFHFLGTIQEPWYTWINDLANAWILFRNPEKVTHPGTLHPDKTFYVIRDLPHYVGLAGWHNRVLGYMLRAERKGCIPVVEHLPDPKTGDPESGRGNWYSYFTAVSRYDPKDTHTFSNVVHVVNMVAIHKRYNRNKIALRHEISQHARLNEQSSSVIYPRYRILFPDGAARYVGIYFRGTDYRVKGAWKPVGHAAVPEYGAFAEEAETAMRKCGLDIGYGERLKPRFSQFKFGVNLPSQIPPDSTQRKNNLLYLLDIYTLSCCDYLIGGVNGGVLMALNLNGNRYKGVHVFNTGVN